MHNSSVYKIRIDFEKSHGSYLYDKNSNQEFLDFFSHYASLPLGYNHPIFNDGNFLRAYAYTAPIKVTNCEIISDEALTFVEEFSHHPSMAAYHYFHFCCTGALAIEAAIKTAIDYKGSAQPMIISLRESFHGINSYGGFLTDRFYPVSNRLGGMPEMGWQKIHNPKMIYAADGIDEQATKRGLEQFVSEFTQCIETYGADNIAGLVIEPIQASYGDNYFPLEFFRVARDLCTRYNICLIFDEVQTGFGTTGKMWYFEHVGIEPDIVVFGKKVQLAGIMCKEPVSKIFKTPVRLEVTWDGNLSDMIRGTYVLRAYEKYHILDNVNQRAVQLIAGLETQTRFKNIRFAGLFIAFDFDTNIERDGYFLQLKNLGFLCNKTREKTIRLRPNLAVSSSEIDAALAIISQVVVLK